jgi:hypothetical protein
MEIDPVEVIVPPVKPVPAVIAVTGTFEEAEVSCPWALTSNDA